MSATSQENQQQIDRLVDGELTDGEQAELLRRLDDQPDGWRLCALAYVEAHEWRRGFRELVDRPETNTVASMVAGTVARRRKLRLFPSVAAALLVGLGCGVGLMALWGQHPATEGVGPKFTSRSTDIPQKERLGNQFPPRPNERLGSSTPDAEIVNVRDGAGSSGWIDFSEIPLVRSSGRFDSGVPSEQPVIPHQIRQAIERLGHQVHERRWLSPVQMQDGRRYLLQFDDVEVEFVGHHPYQ